MDKSFVLAEVKSVDDTADPNGRFEAILSAPTLDRDAEVIAKGAFAAGPRGLPKSIPVHAYHQFTDPIGRGEPFYEGDVLKLRGFFASTPRAQEMRTLVREGVIANMSVGFMEAIRKDVGGVPHIVEAELLEGSMVSVPSNRESAVLMAKSWNDAPDHDILAAVKALSDKIDALTSLPVSAPEAKAAAPASAGAAAEPPASVDVVQEARLAIARASAALLLSD